MDFSRNKNGIFGDGGILRSNQAGTAAATTRASEQQVLGTHSRHGLVYQLSQTLLQYITGI